MITSKVSNKISIVGSVVVSDRDKSGHIMQVLVQTDDFIKYVIENNNTGRDLLNLVNKRVVLTGYVTHQDYDGNNILLAIEYKVLP